ncbi:UrcA family protein [Phenylobacterium sp.]|jgi:UrcA family protein|uniref:UrcA family protein n=1 Tax=Phenylobacterium sp. TaxID=1871053 RepID=UPI002E2EAC8E|nr:UrcA family protein [Phenylobacterium sp.]HEX2559223.1 UrcA family protein [Phenylobacterium sp.]
MKAHLLIAASLVLAAPPALAQTRGEETVALSDLNLRTAEGQEGARRRIRAAASRLCAQPLTPLLPRAATDAWRCRKAAQARAEAQLSPQARSYAAR